MVSEEGLALRRLITYVSCLYPQLIFFFQVIMADYIAILLFFKYIMMTQFSNSWDYRSLKFNISGVSIGSGSSQLVILANFELTCI